MSSISISYTKNVSNKKSIIDNPKININLPNSQKIHIHTPQLNEDSNNKSNYHLYLNTNNFDPNISSSPPNTFMQNLHERMNSYYSPTSRASLVKSPLFASTITDFH